MKRIFRKGLISILIVLLLFNFVSANVAQASGGVIDSIFTGLVGLITWIPRAIIMALLTGVEVLISGLANLGLGEINGYNSPITLFVTPFHVFFNKIAILDVNFFNFTDVNGTVLTFRTAVAGWYYTMRLIACMILAVILIYIGIRMALSTLAPEKVMYKKMLVDWVTSLALLFLLHYIMVFTFACNDAFVNALLNICTETDLTGFMGELTLQALGLETSSAIAAMILYGIIIGQTISFIFAYVKRMLTIGFLIMIAPLITITYSIDKIGDGKAQALNTWLKEFVYNILIQPFHCILFATFASVAFEVIGVGTWTAGSSLAEMILAICCIQFIKTGEEIVKKIFGFSNAGSLATFAGGALVTMAAIQNGGKVGAAVGSGVAKTKNFISNNSDKISKATKGLSSKVGNMTSKLDKVDKDGNLTARGRKIAEKKAEKMTDKQKESNPHLGQNQDAYAAAHQKNYENIENQMKKKFTAKGESVRQKAEKKKEKRETKEREAAVARAEAKAQAKGQKEAVTEEQIQAAAKEIKAEKAEKVQKKAEKVQKKAEKREKRSEKLQEITGVASKFWEKNGQKIASGTMGVVSGLVGLGAGGMTGFMAAQKFGSGLATGYMSNTAATLQKDISGAAQALQNLNADNANFDIANATFGINATNENGGFDKVEDKLEEILNKISGFKSEGDRKNFKYELSSQLAQNPSSVTFDSLNQLAEKYGAEDSDTSAMAAGMRQYAELAATANFARAISTATGAGRTVEEVASAASNTINVTHNTTNNVTTNVSVEANAADVARAVDATVTVEGGVDQKDLSDLASKIGENNTKVDEINRNLNHTSQAIDSFESDNGNTKQ